MLLPPTLRLALFVACTTAWSAAPAEVSASQKVGSLVASSEGEQNPLDLPARLRVEALPLDQALDLLDERSGVSLVYSPSRLPKREVSCQCEDLPVGQALTRLLAGSGMRFSVQGSGGHVVIEPIERPTIERPLSILAQTTASGPTSSAFLLGFSRWLGGPAVSAATVAARGTGSQLHPVTGTVVSTDLVPRAGVSVQLKGTNIGVLTNSAGGYQLNARSPNDTLVFTTLGFTTQEVAVTGRSVVNVTLTPSIVALEGLVAVGYSSQARELVSGSVSQVTSQQLEGSAFNSVADAMMGLVQGANIRMMTGQGGANQTGDFSGQSRLAATGAGAVVAGDPQDGRPGSAAVLQIRNMGTPLFMIDNVPATAEQFNTLNPSDIESVSLLKDASAAVYGFRAANGVVLVTTKRGGLDSAPRVSVSGYYGAQNPTSYHFENLVNAYEFQHSQVDSRANINSITYVNNGSLNYNIPTEVSATDLEEWRLGVLPNRQSYDYYKLIMNNPNAAKYGMDVSVSGGSANAQYRLSLAHTMEEYIIQDPSFARTTISANLSSNLTQRFSVGTELRMSNSRREDIAIQGAVDPMRTALISIHSNWPIYAPFIGPNNDLINDDIRSDQKNRNIGQLDMETVGKATDYRRDFSGNFWAQYVLPFGTTVRGTVTASTDGRQYDLRRTSYSTYRTNPATGEIELAATFANRERQRVRDGNDRTFVSVTATHNLQVGGHSLALVGFWEREGSESWEDITIGVAPTDYTDIINFTDITNTSNGWGISRRASVGGRIDYNYNQKYIVGVLGRYDGTYLYAPDRRWGFFPGVSAAWRITEEGFMQDRLDFLNEAKLRISWGETGSENAGAWDYVEGATYGVGGGSVFGTTLIKGVRPRGLPNLALTWVTNTSKNIGLDLAFFNGRLSTEMDYFERLRTGIPATRSDVILPTEIGYGLPQENLNADITKGFEAIVNWRGQAGGLSYTLSPNVTISRSAPHFRYLQRYGSGYDQYRNGNLVGRWDGTNFGYEVIGQFQSFEEIANHPVNQVNTNTGNRQLLPGDFIFKDVNGDGIISNFDERPIGYSTTGTPILSFGMGSSLQYGNLSLTANFAGGAMYSFLRQFATRELSQNGNMMAKYAQDRWMRADPYDPQSEWIPGSYPPLRKNNSGNSYARNSSFWRTNVRFLRIRRIELGYNVPGSLAENVGLSGLRVYTNVQNPVSFDNMAHIGVDPEVSQDIAVVYPTMRLINVGFSATVGGR